MGRRASRLTAGFLAMLVLFSSPSFAQDPELTPDEAGSDQPKKSYLIPALEIVGFDVALNRFGYRFEDREAFNIGWASIRRNLKRGWVVDHDEFSTNQFLHPY